MDRDGARTDPSGIADVVCTSVCTSPLDEATLRAAIDGVTRALAAADDDAIPELVAERRAMREELAALGTEDADVVRLSGQRARATRPR